MCVANAGTVHADVSITFCPPGSEERSDIPLCFGDFILFVDKTSQDPLNAAVVDFKGDGLGGQLSIKAPYLKGVVPKSDSALRERVQYVIDSEINPNLASHNGRVSIVDILEEKIVVLQFGGGCHGCGMANVTLKHGIEKTLKEKFPEIVEIRDATDHTTGEDPYC
jgi:Fe/S biogenesis protein NfuA